MTMQTDLWKLYTTIPTSLNSQPTVQKSKSCTCAKTWLCSFKLATFHSRPQRPRSFWSAPRIATSGQVQHRKSAIHGLPVTLPLFRVKSDKSDWLWSQSIVFTKPFKNGMSLDGARGRDSWCWPKGAQPLGTRMATFTKGQFSIDARFPKSAFEAVQKTRRTCFIGSKTTQLRLVVYKYFFIYLILKRDFFKIINDNQFPRPPSKSK